LENDSHAFIVRVWVESQDGQGRWAVWRGSIDHVGENKRLYFQDLKGVVRFIQEQAGISKRSKGSARQTIIDWIQNELEKLRRKFSLNRG
jgi:hypothetical protein